jgi:hypothetical protein
MEDPLMAKTTKGEHGEGEINLGLGGVFRGLGTSSTTYRRIKNKGRRR